MAGGRFTSTACTATPWPADAMSPNTVEVIDDIMLATELTSSLAFASVDNPGDTDSATSNALQSASRIGCKPRLALNRAAMSEKRDSSDRPGGGLVGTCRPNCG